MNSLDNSYTPARNLFDKLEQRKAEFAEALYVDPDNIFFEARYFDVPCPLLTVLKVDRYYLHANKISMPDGKTYIASQVPDDYNSFWKSAFVETSLIVDLTTFEETGRIVNEKGLLYYPPMLEKGASQNYNDTCVTFSSIVGLGKGKGYIAQFEVTQDKVTKVFERIHFMHWPNKKTADILSIINIINEIDQRINKGIMPIIHCQGGVGRTGTLISLITINHLMQQNPERVIEDPMGTIEEVIMAGRRDRGPLFVETFDQLEMIVNFTSQLIEQSKKSD